MKLENFSAGVYQKEESKGVIRLVCSAVKEYVESFLVFSLQKDDQVMK